MRGNCSDPVATNDCTSEPTDLCDFRISKDEDACYADNPFSDIGPIWQQHLNSPANWPDRGPQAVHLVSLVTSSPRRHSNHYRATRDLRLLGCWSLLGISKQLRTTRSHRLREHVRHGTRPQSMVKGRGRTRRSGRTLLLHNVAHGHSWRRRVDLQGDIRGQWRSIRRTRWTWRTGHWQDVITGPEMTTKKVQQIQSSVKHH